MKLISLIEMNASYSAGVAGVFVTGYDEHGNEVGEVFRPWLSGGDNEDGIVALKEAGYNVLDAVTVENHIRRDARGNIEH